MGNTAEKPVSNNFDSHQDACKLNEALKKMNTDESAIIQVVTKRSSYQRQAIKDDYKKLFGSELSHDLESQLSGDFKKAVLALVESREKYAAKTLYKAMKGLGTNENILVEIICSQNNTSMNKICEIYLDVYKRTLLEDITSETSGDFRKLLVSMATSDRDESYTVDKEAAAKDARLLFDAGENKFFGTDECVFNSILTTRNYLQLRNIFEVYAGIAGHSFVHAIEAETSGDLLRAYKIIVAMVTDHVGYYATKIREAMRGLGTDEEGLIRCITTREEIDLQLIKRRYNELFGRELWEDINEECSGYFKNLLLNIVNGT